MIRFAKPLIGEDEKRRVLNSLSMDRLTEGPLVGQFEMMFGERFGGYAVAVSSCTAALHLAGMTLEQSTVTVPAMTHPATALAMQAAGRQVEFVDCDSNGCAVADVGVHFLGQACKGKLIEDAATALHLIPDADLACYSFYPAKQLTTGEGGMVLCKDRNAANEIRSMRAFGKPDFNRFGLNYRMSEINAALGIAQLNRLSEFIEKRRTNEIALRAELAGIEVIGSNYALSVIVPEGVDRDTIRSHLFDNGVETSVYYAQPVPHTPYFGETQSYPNAERISSRSITLSIGPHLTTSDMILQAVMVKELLLSEGQGLSATILPFDSTKRDITSRS